MCAGCNVARLENWGLEQYGARGCEKKGKNPHYLQSSAPLAMAREGKKNAKQSAKTIEKSYNQITRIGTAQQHTMPMMFMTDDMHTARPMKVGEYLATLCQCLQPLLYLDTVLHTIRHVIARIMLRRYARDGAEPRRPCQRSCVLPGRKLS